MKWQDPMVQFCQRHDFGIERIGDDLHERPWLRDGLVEPMMRPNRRQCPVRRSDEVFSRVQPRRYVRHDASSKLDTASRGITVQELWNLCEINLRVSKDEGNLSALDIDFRQILSKNVEQILGR